MSRRSDVADHREIDHEGPDAAFLHDCRAAIDDALTDIVGVLHEVQPLAPGEKWTIDVGMSCGLSGSIVIRLDAQGPCGRVRGDGGVAARPNAAG